VFPHAEVRRLLAYGTLKCGRLRTKAVKKILGYKLPQLLDTKPSACMLPSMRMARSWQLSETEKITINLGLVDLGQIDLLVQEGFYQNRTDFIRTAIRNQLNAHADAVKQTVARKELVLGLQHYSRRDLEAVRAVGEKLEIRVLGLASIADDVPPELVLETIDSIDVLGAFRASPDVKAALAGRIRST
jgi:Arc/MetJ-type ribon-helix-helix transcriptional regulator